MNELGRMSIVMVQASQREISRVVSAQYLYLLMRNKIRIVLRFSSDLHIESHMYMSLSPRRIDTAPSKMREDSKGALMAYEHR